MVATRGRQRRSGTPGARLRPSPSRRRVAPRVRDSASEAGTPYAATASQHSFRVGRGQLQSWRSDPSSCVPSRWADIDSMGLGGWASGEDVPFGLYFRGRRYSFNSTLNSCGHVGFHASITALNHICCITRYVLPRPTAVAWLPAHSLAAPMPYYRNTSRRIRSSPL